MRGERFPFTLNGLLSDGSREHTEGQPHEDAVEPHLVGIDGLVPVDLVGQGARLVLQLPHHSPHGEQVFLFWPLLVHAGDEVAGADIVEVIVEDVVAAYVTLLVNHRVGIFLAIAAYVLAAIAQVSVEHALQLDAHDVAPFGLRGEIEQVRLRRALHLAVGHPFGIVFIGHLCQAERAVHHIVVVADVACLSGDFVALSHTVKAAIADVHVVDIAHGVQADDQHAVPRLPAGDVFRVHVPDRRVVAPAAYLVVLVVEVDLDDGLAALSHLDVAQVDVLNDAASAAVGLDAQYAVQVGRVHHAVVGVDILAAARDFRAYHHAAVPVVHGAPPYDDILRGHVPFSSVAVASALDGNAVVAGAEEAVLYEHTVAALRVAAVAVGAFADYFHAAHGDVGGVQGMDGPEGRLQQGDILQQDALTPVEADQLRAETVFRAKDALRVSSALFIIHGYAVFAISQQAWPGFQLLADQALLPSEPLYAYPVPPGIVASAAVDGSLAGDGDVVGLEGVDARREVKTFQSLPRGLDDGV